MREGWTETTLSEVLLPVVTRAKDNSEYEVLSVTERRGIIPQTEVFNHRIATEDISKYKVLQPGDIAFNPYLLWCGAVGQWKGNYEGVVSPVYECFRARDTDLPRFIGLIFESGVLTPYFDSTAIGSIVRRRRTTLPVFYEALIIRPPLDVQKRIVDVVSSVDAYIDALQQQADKARTARNAVLHELLSAGRSDWSETTINIKRVEDFAFLKRGHDLPTQSRVDGSYPVVASNGSVGYHDECIGPVPGVVTGRSGTIGKVMYLEDGYWPLNTTLYVTDFMGNNEKFVALTLEIMHLENFAGGTTVPSLDRKVFRSELVYVPTFSEQARIVEIVSSMDEVIQSTEQAVTDAKNLRSGLLSDLLSGEHEIPASYDVFVGAA